MTVATSYSHALSNQQYEEIAPELLDASNLDLAGSTWPASVFQCINPSTTGKSSLFRKGVSLHQ